MTEFEPRVEITQYTVSVYPDPDSIDADLFEITVEYRGGGNWAVCKGGACYDRKGFVSFEPMPSERTKAWLRRWRFPSAELALKVARKVAPTVVVNGMNAADCWAREQAKAVTS